MVKHFKNVTWFLIVCAFLGRLKGKVVFITGASSGIGEHTAYSLAKFGVKLALAARRPHELQRVKNKCLGNFTKRKKQKTLILFALFVD